MSTIYNDRLGSQSVVFLSIYCPKTAPIRTICIFKNDLVVLL